MPFKELDPGKVGITSEDKRDKHIHVVRLDHLDDDGNGFTELAAGSGSKPHKHYIQADKVIPHEDLLGGYVSEHDGAVSLVRMSEDKNAKPKVTLPSFIKNSEQVGSEKKLQIKDDHERLLIGLIMKMTDEEYVKLIKMSWEAGVVRIPGMLDNPEKINILANRLWDRDDVPSEDRKAAANKFAKLREDLENWQLY